MEIKESSYTCSVKELPLHERPRERMHSLSASALSIEELIAVIFGSGGKNHEVLELGRRVKKELIQSNGGKPFSIDTLNKIPGIGPAKACQILASLELSRRIQKLNKPQNPKITTPEVAVLEIEGDYADIEQEMVSLILVNQRDELIHKEVIFLGTLNQAPVFPREVFRSAVRQNAAGIILIHNHPSGDPTPSQEDILLTQNLLELARTMEIPLLDHIIIGTNGNNVTLPFISMRRGFDRRLHVA